MTVQLTSAECSADLPKLDAFGLLDSFVCISLFGLDVGSERAVMSSHDTLMVFTPNPSAPSLFVKSLLSLQRKL
jgi:hypothetical protein